MSKAIAKRHPTLLCVSSVNEAYGQKHKNIDFGVDWPFNNRVEGTSSQMMRTDRTNSVHQT